MILVNFMLKTELSFMESTLTRTTSSEKTIHTAKIVKYLTQYIHIYIYI